MPDQPCPMLSPANITGCTVHAFTVPTDAPEGDGTCSWSETTMVLVRLTAAGHTGLGYTYAAAATASFVQTLLSHCVAGTDAFAHARTLQAMLAHARNNGVTG